MSLRLPTLATFQRLSIKQRTALFGRWLKAQSPGRKANYWNGEICPLARFGNAITRTHGCYGGGWAFELPHLSGDVVVFKEDGVPYDPLTSKLNSALMKRTYGEVSTAYNAALRKTPHGQRSVKRAKVNA